MLIILLLFLKELFRLNAESSATRRHSYYKSRCRYLTAVTDGIHSFDFTSIIVDLRKIDVFREVLSNLSKQVKI